MSQTTMQVEWGGGGGESDFSALLGQRVRLQGLQRLRLRHFPDTPQTQPRHNPDTTQTSPRHRRPELNGQIWACLLV